MRKKVVLITIVLLILISSTTLCFTEDDKPKPKPEGPWHDLTNFNGFLEQRPNVIYKDETGANLIKSVEDPEGALYVVVGVDEGFTDSEAAALHHFVESGGNIIVAADDEKVNNLSKKFDIEYSPHMILDKGFDYNYTFIPLVVNNMGNSFSIVVHAPHALEISAANYEVIGQSAYYPETIESALDLNDNRIIDAADRPGPIPIIVQVTVKSGNAIFISDAGLFSDNLWKLSSIYDKPNFEGHVYENQEYIIDLVNSLHEPEKTLIYDRSKQINSHSNFHPYPAPE